jgi:hypothetical protein
MLNYKEIICLHYKDCYIVKQCICNSPDAVAQAVAVANPIVGAAAPGEPYSGKAPRRLLRRCGCASKPTGTLPMHSSGRHCAPQ